MKQGNTPLVAVIAHPDDETLFSGTLALCAQEGIATTVICATNGGGGWAPNGMSAGELSSRRREALREACDLLGVRRVEFLEEPPGDAGCLGKNNYAAAVDLHRRRVAALLDEIKPGMVITFGPEGFTGHPTHIMVGHLTTQAVLAMSRPPLLYYSAFSEEQVGNLYRWFDSNPQVMAEYSREVGAKPNLGSPKPQLYAVSDGCISVTVNIAPVLETKRLAWRRHGTQGGGGQVLDVFGANLTESFALVFPGDQERATGGLTGALGL